MNVTPCLPVITVSLRELLQCLPKQKNMLTEVLKPPLIGLLIPRSAQDLLTDHHVPDHYGYYSDNPIRLITANGESSSMKQGKVKVPELNATVSAYTHTPKSLQCLRLTAVPNQNARHDPCPGTDLAKLLSPLETLA